MKVDKALLAGLPAEVRALYEDLDRGEATVLVARRVSQAPEPGDTVPVAPGEARLAVRLVETAWARRRR